MTETTVELSRETLKQILAMHVDATELLEEIPKLLDQGRLSEASQHIGAELEARVTEMNEAEKRDHIIRELLEEVSNDQIQDSSESLEDLEDEILD
jgi:hypothetical protein